MASQLKPAYSYPVLENCRRAWEKMEHTPSLVSRIVQVQRRMAFDGLAPFVHAAPASANVPFAFYRTVQRTNPFFQPLRSPIDPQIRSVQEMWKKVPSAEIKAPKPNLLSVSYPFPSNTSHLEFAADWGCCNHFGNEQWFLMCGILCSFFNQYKTTFKEEIPPSFEERARHLIIEYNRLKVGTFLVVGVPKNRLPEWMYDSKPYNIPTGRSIEEVFANPERAADGNFATLVISRESLDPDSGIVVVDANNPSQVRRFCVSEPWLDLESPSSREADEEAERKRLNCKLRTLIDDFQYWRVHQTERAFVDDFVPRSSDFPGYMI